MPGYLPITSIDDIAVGDKLRHRRPRWHRWSQSSSNAGLYLVTAVSRTVVYAQPIHGTDTNRCIAESSLQLNWLIHGSDRPVKRWAPPAEAGSGR